MDKLENNKTSFFIFFKSLLEKGIFYFKQNPSNFLFFFFMFIALVVGFFTTQDYGLSWDELGIFAYSKQTLPAYQFISHPWDFEAPLSEALLHLYGPSHFMLSTVFSRYIDSLSKAWSFYDANHFFYFLTFLFCVCVVYFLCKRWMSGWASLGITILFTTQPLFWGNAFINPKDIPFLTFFTASIYFGFLMIDSLPKLVWWKFLIASAILGFATSIRSIAPMAGGIVILYGLFKYKKEVLKIIPYYVGVTIIFTYLTWPYLWSSPIPHFMESILTMSKYPMTFDALFMGNIYSVDKMPLSYFPTFVAIQLTEPMLVLMLLGIIVSLYFFIKGKNKEPFLLFVLWFSIPSIAVILSGSTFYDNARQFMFLLPPLIIVAGIGLDKILTYIKAPLVKWLLVLVMIFPGLYACIRLHPYQYIYYNQLVGGVDGAFRKFDLDYSGTSYKEAMKYINENAQENTQIVVFGPRHLTRIYIRPALKENIAGEFDPIYPNGTDYYYVLLLTRGNADMNICVDSENVYSIERDGGVLAYIRKVYSKEPCW